LQQRPAFSEGFHDAWAGEPLFDDAHADYKAGWQSYWNVRAFLADTPARNERNKQQAAICGV